MRSVIADPFAATAIQVAALLALLLFALALVALGAAACGTKRAREADLVAGWGIACAAFSLVGVTTRIPFSWILVALFAAAAVALALAARRGWGLDGGLARVLAMGLPLLLLVAATVPWQWDEFTHWLPNARYLFEHDTFPRDGLPASSSMLPAYPYGYPLPIYVASRLSGAFAENAGALFNMLLLFASASLVVRVIRIGAGTDASGAVPSWALCAFGLLTASVLNPAFDDEIAFAAYADLATAAATGFAGVLGWMTLEAMSQDDRARARALAWQAGLALTALVSIKQSAVVLAIAATLALLFVAARDRVIGVKAFARILPRVIVLPVLVYAVWRIHIALHIPHGEVSVRPMAEWAIDAIPHSLTAMALIASEKPGFFGLMLVAVGFAVRGALRMKTPLDRLAVVVGSLFVAQNAMLLFTYIAAFTEEESMEAASYWRYNTQLGFLGVAFAAFGLATLWRRHGAWPMRRSLAPLGWAAVALVVTTPIALSGPLRFDKHAPRLYVRAVARDMAGMLERVDRLALIDASGEGTYAEIVRYVTNGSPPVVAIIRIPPGPGAADGVRRQLAMERPSHVWVHVPTDAIEEALGVELPELASSLVARSGDGWRVVKSWPYPGYGLPWKPPE